MRAEYIRAEYIGFKQHNSLEPQQHVDQPSEEAG